MEPSLRNENTPRESSLRNEYTREGTKLKKSVYTQGAKLKMQTVIKTYISRRITTIRGKKVANRNELETTKMTRTKRQK